MKWSERVFIEDGVHYRVGPVRLRQLRSKPGNLQFLNLKEIVLRLKT